MTLTDNIFVDVGRSIAKPFSDEVSPYTALAVFVVFLILLWWVTDALLIQGRLLKAAEELIGDNT